MDAEWTSESQDFPSNENVVHTRASAGQPTGGQAKYEEEGSNPSERQEGSVTGLR